MPRSITDADLNNERWPVVARVPIPEGRSQILVFVNASHIRMSVVSGIDEVLIQAPRHGAKDWRVSLNMVSGPEKNVENIEVLLPVQYTGEVIVNCK